MCHCGGDTRDIGPHPSPQKIVITIIPKGAKDVLSFCPVSFTSLHYMCMENKAARTKPRKTPSKQRENKPNATDHHQTSERRRRKKTKTQGREPDLGVDVEQGVRVEEMESACRKKRTQGETQTKKVWVSPAPERKRKEERTRRRRNQPNNQRKKKRGQRTSWLTGVRS